MKSKQEVRSTRSTLGGLIALVVSLALFVTSYMIPIPWREVPDSASVTEEREGTVARQDTVIRPVLSPGFQHALTRLCMLDFARCTMETAITQHAQDDGFIADVVDLFTDVSLDMRCTIPVEITVGLDAEAIQIADVSFTEDGRRVEHMTVILPPLQVTGASIDYDEVRTHFREGHVHGTIEVVMGFLAESDSTAIEAAIVLAAESGLIDEAESKAILEVSRLLQAMGVMHADVMVASASSSNAVNVALLENEKGR